MVAAAVDEAVDAPTPPDAALLVAGSVRHERDDLVGALTGHGYRNDARTFFIWEGVTQYLTEDAVRTTLGALQSLGNAWLGSPGAGSR